jgi:hypothetical protein
MIQINARIIVSFLSRCLPERLLGRWQMAELIIIVQVDRRGDLYLGFTAVIDQAVGA